MKRWIIGFAAVVLLVGGADQAYANFVLSFDENGNATLTNNGVPIIGYRGGLLPDPVEGGSSLTYLLPNSVGAGDVLINEPVAAAITISDMLRFTNANGALTGNGADRMIYYSNLEPNEVQGGPGTDVADRIFSIRTTFAIVEVGPEGNNGFQYGVPNTSDNVYNGISDGAAQVPEPATLALLGVGLAGLSFARRRKRD